MLPSYKDMMLPILEFVAQRKEANRAEISKFIIEYFKLSDDEILQKIKSGTFTYISRTGWALSYLATTAQVKSKPEKVPLQKVGRSLFAITNFGKELVSSKDKKSKFLSWYDEIYKQEISQEEKEATENTPDDNIDEALCKIKEELKSEILSSILEKEPRFFEYLVTKLLEKMNYGAGNLTNKGPDGGIDGIIDEDELGLSKIYIQAKRYKDGSNIRRPEIQQFIGAISNKNTKKASLSLRQNLPKKLKISPKIIKNFSVVLIDGDKLAELMIKYKVGVQTSQIYEICKIDTDFFEENNF
ncbi:restriction endonuclease [Campylobacter concisus]|uniref:restriction endonuclease n=1 Tax=Campylobacter concisus TaxID=199 RepID=UPI00215663A2|nr:restriction endonuclease [Campylobacter concisus]